jgi:hypothetical protein
MLAIEVDGSAHDDSNKFGAGTDRWLLTDTA